MGAPLPPKVTRLYVLSASFFAAIVAVNIYIFSQAFWGKSSGAPGNSSEAAETLPTNLLPVDKVKGLAAAEVPNVPITKIELHPEGEKFVYDISLADNTMLKLDAQTGAKLATTINKQADTDKETLKTDSPTIDFTLARQIALTQKPAGIVNTIELGTKDGKAVYRVRFADSSLVIIAATNGTIVQIEEAPKDASNTVDSTKNGATTSTPNPAPQPQPNPAPTDPSPSSTPSSSPTTP